MKKIDIYFLNKKLPNGMLIDIKSDQYVKIKIGILNLSNFELSSGINKINNIITIYSNIKRINLIFDNIPCNIACNIISKLHNILYQYNNIIDGVKIYKANKETSKLMLELKEYKDIAMDPNKHPDTYLKWIQSNVPSNYKSIVKKTTEKFFPLTHAVSMGSRYDSYFVHILPKKIDNNKINLYLIGKAVTFDSGGLNLKNNGMHEMKIDMIGSALLVTILKLLSKDVNVNIHLLLPVVENMIGMNATRPGTIIKSMSGKTVEILNTDAEGRLCIADCIDYINMKLIDMKKNNLIIDIATLTGSAISTTGTISSIGMSNMKGATYLNQIIETGENCGEYVDQLKLREEYHYRLNSSVADIKNCDTMHGCDCILGGMFLKYFTNDMIPWIHLDIAGPSYDDMHVTSYGVNLLCEFIDSL